MLLVQQEQLGIRPDVAGIGGDEERQVAQQEDAFVTCMTPRAPALAKQQELRETNPRGVTSELPPGRHHGARFSTHQLYGPVEIISAFVLGLQRAKQGVIFEPGHLAVAILLESGPQLEPCPGAEVVPGPFEQPTLERDYGVIIDLVRRERDALAVARPQQSILDQIVRAEQELVTGERG